MRIAIFHNLEKGGALNSLIEPLKCLKKYSKIDIYCFQKNIPENLVDNFIGYYLNHSDFVLASRIVGSLVIFTFVIISIIIGITLILLLLKRYKQYPKLVLE